MSYKMEDLYKKTESHCHDCKKDVTAMLVPLMDGIKVKKGDFVSRDELHVDCTVPVSLECPTCEGHNVGDFIINITLDKNGLVG